MRSFGELLTEYAARAGIGDSELARRVQVNRLTLIRWKEGVTARPRYREDALRCAEVLRLSDEERDLLLVAAGFTPESAPALGEAGGAAAQSAAAERPRRSFTRRLRVGLAVAVIAAVAAGVALMRSAEPPPPAAGGREAPSL